MKTIKIAPDLNEIRIRKNVASVEFNGMRITFTMIAPLNRDCHKSLKIYIQSAIGMSSKSWQVEHFLNDLETTDGKKLGTCKIESIA